MSKTAWIGSHVALDETCHAPHVHAAIVSARQCAQNKAMRGKRNDFSKDAMR
jgi:hypothetical protein